MFLDLSFQTLLWFSLIHFPGFGMVMTRLTASVANRKLLLNDHTLQIGS